MASVKGTKTEKNLLAAFAGESQARNRYTYAASVAKKEGYEQIAAIFWRRRKTSASTPSAFSSILKAAWWRSAPHIRPEPLKTPWKT